MIDQYHAADIPLEVMVFDNNWNDDYEQFTLGPAFSQADMLVRDPLPVRTCCS